MATDDQGIVGEELLTKTGSGGLFNRGYLADQPIESYLDPHEQPRVVFATDGTGVVTEGPQGQTTYEPGSDYRTVVALTTQRVVLVVGGATDDGGDRLIDIPLTRIDHVASASGFRQSIVRLWIGEDVWELSSETADPETVETYLSKASQRRIRFERLLGEAEDGIVAAGDHLTAGRFPSVEEALDRADRALEEAREPVESFPADARDMEALLAAYRDRYRSEEQRLQLSRIEQNRECGREQCQNEAYERAANAYDRSRAICETLLEREGVASERADRTRDVLTSIERDRTRLAVAPVQTAAAYRRSAEGATLPGDAAERWREAYDRYRQVLELDWGEETDRFAGDADRIRERLTTIAAELLAARSRAAAQHRRAAIRLTTVQATTAAMDAYGDARDHLEAAVETARELDPTAVSSLRERLDLVEQRMTVLAESDAETGRAGTRASGGPPIGTAGPVRLRPVSERPGIVPVRTDESPPAVRRLAPDGETTLAVFGPSDDQQTTLAVLGPSDNEQTTLVPRTRDPRAQYVRHVDALDGETLHETVTDIWQKLGWTVEADADGTALRASRPGVGTTLLLTVRTRGDPVGPSAISALAADRDRREDDPWPVLVTTDAVEPAAFETAISAGVTIIDTRSLAELWYQTDDQPDDRHREPASNPA